MNTKIRRRRSTAVVIHKGKILGYHGDDPANGRRYFFLPGGAIEPGEAPAQSAVRETLEETGYAVDVVLESEVLVRYDFNWANNIYDCETYFYRGNVINDKPKTVHDASYHRGICWLELSAIDEALSYSNEILSAVRGLIEEKALPGNKSHQSRIR